MITSIILSLMAGVTIVVSRIINSKLSSKIGLLSSTFYNYLMGLIFSLVIFSFTKELHQINLLSFSKVPWWGYLGGAFGVIAVSLSSYITPKISVFYFSILGFLGQLFIGIVVDYIISGNLSIAQGIGGLLVLTGLIFNVLIDKTDLETSII